MTLNMEYEELEFLEAPSVLFSFAQNLKKLFSRAHKSIKVFSGEAHWMLYSHPFVLDTLREKHKEGVKIDFVAGPVLSVCKRGNEKYLGLICLQKEGVIRLYSRNKRGPHDHFVIIDDEIASIEHHHPPLLPLGDRHKTELKAGSKEFKEILNFFSRYLKEINPTKDPYKDFVLMTPLQIHSIIKSGTEFDELTKNELKKELEHFEEGERRNKIIAEEISKSISSM